MSLSPFLSLPSSSHRPVSFPPPLSSLLQPRFSPWLSLPPSDSLILPRHLSHTVPLVSQSPVLRSPAFRDPALVFSVKPFILLPSQSVSRSTDYLDALYLPDLHSPQSSGHPSSALIQPHPDVHLCSSCYFREPRRLLSRPSQPCRVCAPTLCCLPALLRPPTHATSSANPLLLSVPGPPFCPVPLMFSAPSVIPAACLPLLTPYIHFGSM